MWTFFPLLDSSVGSKEGSFCLNLYCQVKGFVCLNGHQNIDSSIFVSISKVVSSHIVDRGESVLAA